MCVSSNSGSSQAASSADNIAPKLNEKFNRASADPRSRTNLLPAKILIEAISCPSPNPPTNSPTDPSAIPPGIVTASANPPNPASPATIPRTMLRRRSFSQRSPPRNAQQNFAVISRPLCASCICHCFASSGRIGPSSAVPSPHASPSRVVQPPYRWHGASFFSAAVVSVKVSAPRKDLQHPLLSSKESSSCLASSYFHSQLFCCSLVVSRASLRQLPANSATSSTGRPEDLLRPRPGRLRQRL